MVKERLDTMPDRYKQWNGITMYGDIWLDGMPLQKDSKLNKNGKR